MEDMKVAQIEYSRWGDEKSPTSNWSLIQKHGCFSHAEACEFIIHLGDKDYFKERVKDLTDFGFSKDFITLCKKANEQGFKYACFYC